MIRPDDIKQVILESIPSIKLIYKMEGGFLKARVIGTSDTKYLARLEYGIEEDVMRNGGNDIECRAVDKKTLAVSVPEFQELYVPYFICPKCGNKSITVTYGDASVRGTMTEMNEDGTMYGDGDEIVYGVGSADDVYACSNPECNAVIATGGIDSLHEATHKYAEMVGEYDKYIPEGDPFWKALPPEMSLAKNKGLTLTPYSFKCPGCGNTAIRVWVHGHVLQGYANTGSGEVVSFYLDTVPSKEHIELACSQCERNVTKWDVEWKQ